jgi:hypothetical protein
LLPSVAGGVKVSVAIKSPELQGRMLESLCYRWD